jgi:conjugative relaxase-like TrwC/TraI family protein
MLTISKPLSAAQIRSYHAEEFSNARENYYTEGERIVGEWHGRLAERWGLSGGVREEQIERLANGRHPLTNEQFIQHHASHTYTNRSGKTVHAMAHRAGWDATFSAPKSVSLTALVGQDDQVAAAHRASVRAALAELEPYVQARIGRNHPAETKGQWVAALFEHDSARPVDGYAAPQLHTHVVIFNLTERADGDVKALQPRELYKTQRYATAVYRSDLASRLAGLGYEIERGSSGQPEIRGYSKDYLEASSPRRQQIQAHLEKVNQHSAEAAHIAAHQTRGAKIVLTHQQMQSRHAQVAEAYGDQPSKIVRTARERASTFEHPTPTVTPHAAVAFSTERNLERDAVVDPRALLRDALSRSMGELTVDTVKHEFSRRVDAGALIVREEPSGIVGRSVTTPEMVALERDIIQRMRDGQQTQPPLASDVIQHRIPEAYPELSDDQQRAVQQILASRDRVQALEGVAGGGKTTALIAVRLAAEREGFRVEGLAPTSRAAHQLSEAGIRSMTLQAHLARSQPNAGGSPRLFVLDESSLAGTRQMDAFLRGLGSTDRVLLVGDTRQHQAVEAGRPFQQLQETGIHIARLDRILRQRDPALLHVVEHLSRGEVAVAIRQLDQQGRVTEIADRDTRLAALANAYAANPEGALVISPDNQSRMDLNQLIHRQLQEHGDVDPREHVVRVLVARQEVTGADRQWAAQYEPGNIVRYTSGSRALGLPIGDYARVVHIDPGNNRITVARRDDRWITYDPSRLHGVTLFRETERAFARGDRIQFTLPHRGQHLANRELGTIERVRANGDLDLRLDSGRQLYINIHDHPHLDYGYAITSHSAQGQTADRVLVHVDTERLGPELVNQRLAYVGISRARYDAHIYTNDKERLGEALSRQTSHSAALEQSVGSTVGQGETQPSRAIAHAIAH